jgi:hypothetical protein
MNLLMREVEKVISRPISRKICEWELNPMTTFKANRLEDMTMGVRDAFRLELIFGINAVFDDFLDLAYAKRDLFERLSRYLYSEIFDALLSLRGEILSDISREEAIKKINEIIDLTR